MRRMYSENQVIELVKQAFEEGKISGGTKLYKHEISGGWSQGTLICAITIITTTSEQLKKTNIRDFFDNIVSVYPIGVIDDDMCSNMSCFLEKQALEDNDGFMITGWLVNDDMKYASSSIKDISNFVDTVSAL